ncbi:MAG: ribonuclease III [Thermoanaerobaculia bacterium]
MLENLISLTGLEERLRYRFRQPRLLEAALTHTSWANEQGVEDDYERLEFLGDAILGAVAASWLYDRRPDLDEGELSKLKSYVVSESVLAEHAEHLGLGQYLRLGVGESRSGGREKRSLLADAMEAILGAVYQDGGLEAARGVALQLLESALGERVEISELRDPKTALQEAAQTRGGSLPEYRHVAEEGPDHKKRFHVECWVDGLFLGEGDGSTKKQAEQRAARVALAALEDDSQESDNALQ